MSENIVKYIENEILGEGYYSIDHKSGLKILVYPKSEYTSPQMQHFLLEGNHVSICTNSLPYHSALYFIISMIGNR